MPRLNGLVLGLLLFLAIPARGEGPADDLFRLVPVDSDLTLAIDDLRGHARAFLGSRLADNLRGLPAFREWRASKQFQGFEQGFRGIAKALGEEVATLRDDLLGDAVVLSLVLDPGGRQDQARGLLLVRARDRALLDRLIRGLDAAQLKSGELARVSGRVRGGTRYGVREYRPGLQKPTEYYTTIADNTFAWSNSEDLIRGVIDRKSGALKGLGAEPAFRTVRQRLPARAAASVFVSPRFLKALSASAIQPPKKPDAGRLAAALARYLDAVSFAGAALEWRDGLILHTEEVLDSDKLDPWLKRWVARPSGRTKLRGIPTTAIAMASIHVDFEALGSLWHDLTPESDRARLDTLRVALNGLLLGQDARTSILPRLGPNVLAFLDMPPREAARLRLPTVVMAEVGGGTGPVTPAAALDNALKTVLALYALDSTHGNGRLRVETREILGHKVTTLAPSTPFAYAIDPDRVTLGKPPRAVARALTRDAAKPSPFDRLRADYFPDVESFACADLGAIRTVALAHREEIIRRLATRHHRPEPDEGRDLDRVLGVIGLFQGAFFTSAIAPDATSVHRMLGLIAREAAAAPRPAAPPASR